MFFFNFFFSCPSVEYSSHVPAVFLPPPNPITTTQTGSLGWAAALSLSYLYMVASWGGYTFIINLLPIHCLACVASGRLTPRLYVAYAPLIAIGTLEAASIPVVGFNAVLMSEHFGAFLAFAVLHAALAGRAAKYLLPPRVFDAALRLGVAAGACCGAAAVAAIVGYVAASPTFGWTGRSLSLVRSFVFFPFFFLKISLFFFSYCFLFFSLKNRKKKN